MVDNDLKNRGEGGSFYSCPILSCIRQKMREEKWSVEVKKEMTFWMFIFCLLHQKKKSFRKTIDSLASRDKLSLLIFSPQISQVPCLGVLRVFCVRSSQLWRQWEPLNTGWKMLHQEGAGHVCHTGFWLLPLSHLCYRDVFAVSLKRCTCL